MNKSVNTISIKTGAIGERGDELAQHTTDVEGKICGELKIFYFLNEKLCFYGTNRSGHIYIESEKSGVENVYE